MINTNVLTESAIHYAKGFLERYKEQYPSKKHKDTLSEFTRISDVLLESLEQPFKITIHRHKLRDE